MESVTIEVPREVIRAARDRFERRLEEDPDGAKDVTLEDYVWDHLAVELDLPGVEE